MTNESVTTSPKNLIDDRLDSQAFPMFKLRQNFGSTSSQKNDQDTSSKRLASSSHVDYKTSTSHFPSALAAASPAIEITSREFHFQPEGVSQNPGGQVNSHKSLEGCSLAVPRPSQDNLIGTTPQIVSYRSNRGRTPMSSSRSGHEGINRLGSALASKQHSSNTNFRILDNKKYNYQRDSAFLVCEKTTDIQSKSRECGTSFSFLRQNKASLSLHDPSASNNTLPVCIGEQFQKLQNFSGIGFFPSQRSIPSETMKSEKLYHGGYSIHDKKSMRIYTTVDSVDGLPAGRTKYSHTTRSVLISKTDVNLYKENQTFRESRESTKLRGNTYGDFLSLSPLSGHGHGHGHGHGQGGVKLQYLGSSSNSYGKDNLQDVKTSEALLKNESSTDTDTMDMDAFKENHLSGVNSSSSNKDINGAQNLRSQAILASTSEEVGCRCSITGLPDINEEPTALPAASSSMDNLDPSTSRTQSLDVEHLLSHAEQLSNSKVRPCLDSPLGPELSSRWVKRLKLSVPNSFPLGTKSSNLGESSPHEKVNKIFSKIRERRGKEPEALDQTAVILRTGEPSSVDSEKRSRRDLLLSHSWIQRWCHNQSATRQKKPEVVITCEPQSSKLALDDVQKKQLPSIAAMALMGKAMNGFQPCEFQSRGSCVVWNTRGC